MNRKKNNKVYLCLIEPAAVVAVTHVNVHSRAFSLYYFPKQYNILMSDDSSSELIILDAVEIPAQTSNKLARRAKRSVEQLSPDCEILEVKQKASSSQVEILSTRTRRPAPRLHIASSAPVWTPATPTLPAINPDRILHSIMNTSPEKSRNRMIPIPKIVDNEPRVEPAMLKCTICLTLAGEKTQLCSTVCGHIFCKPCLEEALRISKNCPNCRKKLGKKSYHPIFL
jgi:hypothetical protein